MHDHPKLVGYGNQLAWNCFLLACMKIEHFHHKKFLFTLLCIQVQEIPLKFIGARQNLFAI